MTTKQPAPQDQLAAWLTESGHVLRYAISLRSPNGSVLQLADAIKPEFASWQININVQATKEPQQ